MGGRDCRVIFGSRSVHSLILRRGYCVPVKHRLRQLYTEISAGNTGIALREARPVQETGAFHHSIRQLSVLSGIEKVYYVRFTNHAWNNFSLCILPQRAFH